MAEDELPSVPNLRDFVKPEKEKENTTKLSVREGFVKLICIIPEKELSSNRKVLDLLLENFARLIALSAWNESIGIMVLGRLRATYDGLMNELMPVSMPPEEGPQDGPEAF